MKKETLKNVFSYKFIYIATSCILGGIFAFFFIQQLIPAVTISFNAIIFLYWVIFFGFSCFAFFNVMKSHEAKKKMETFFCELKNKDAELETFTPVSVDSEEPFIKEICQAYKESFLPHPMNSSERTRSNADLYFGATSWLDDSFHRYSLLSVLKLIPGTFTGFGILGTFLGFASGVSHIVTTEGSEKLLDGVNMLLSGLTTAFNTSIYGIIASIFVNYLLIQPLLRALSGTSKKLCDFLDQRFYISEVDAIMQYSLIVDEDENKIPFSDSLRMITDSLHAMDSSLEAFNADLADKITNFNTDMSSKLAEGFTSQNGSLSHLEECFTDNFSGLGEALKNFQQNSIEGMVDGVQDAVSKTLDQHLSNLREDAEKTSNLLSECSLVLEETPKLLQQAADTLKGTVEISMEEFQKQSEESIATLTSSIETNLNKHFDTFADRVEDSAETFIDIQNSISLLPERFHSVDDALGNTIQMMNKSVDSLAAHLASVSVASEKLESLFEVFQNTNQIENENFQNMILQFQGLFDEYKAVSDECTDILREFKKMDNSLANVFDTINQYTTKYSETVGSSLSNYMNSFASAASSFGTDLQGTVVTLGSSIDGAREAANILASSVDMLVQENKKNNSDKDQK